MIKLKVAFFIIVTLMLISFFSIQIFNHLQLPVSEASEFNLATEDIQNFFQDWHNTEFEKGANINDLLQDGIIDHNDLFLFASAWNSLRPQAVDLTPIYTEGPTMSPTPAYTNTPLPEIVSGYVYSASEQPLANVTITIQAIEDIPMEEYFAAKAFPRDETTRLIQTYWQGGPWGPVRRLGNAAQALSSSGTPVTTDENGFFEMNIQNQGFGEGSYVLDFNKEGYAEVHRRVDLAKAEQFIVENVYMKAFETLPAIDGDSGGTVQSTNGDIALEFDEGIAPGEQVEVKVAEYSGSKDLPGALPSTSFFTMAQSLEAFAYNKEAYLAGRRYAPRQVTTTNPFVLRIRNTMCLPPGMKVPIGQWNRNNLQWEPPGRSPEPTFTPTPYQDTGSISGVLVDAKNQSNPLGNIELIIQNTTGTYLRKITTGELGHFDFADLPEDSYEIYAEGYYFEPRATYDVYGGTDYTDQVLKGNKIPDVQTAGPDADDTDFDPSLAIDANGTVHLAWVRGKQLWHSYYDSDSDNWVVTGIIPSATAGNKPILIGGPDLLADTPNAVMALWRQQIVSTLEEKTELVYSIGVLSGTTCVWTDPKVLVSDQYNNKGVSAALLPTGKVLTVWQKSDATIKDDTDLYYDLITPPSASQAKLSGYLIIPADKFEEILKSYDPAAAGETCIGVRIQQGKRLPSWLPYIGGKYEFEIVGQVCGEADCELGLSGSLNASAEFTDRITGEASFGGEASWGTDQENCAYVFENASLNGSLGVTGRIPVAPYNIVIAKLEVGLTVGGSVSGTLTWRGGNFPGWPNGGRLTLSASFGPYGTAELLGGLIEASINGVGTVSAIYDNRGFRFGNACISLSAEGSVGWFSASFSKEWCLRDSDMLIGVMDSDQRILLPDGALQIGDGLVLRVREFYGTGSVYPGNTVLADVSKDLVIDGQPDLTILNDSTAVLAWKKDSNDQTSWIGNSIKVASYNNNTFSEPEEIPESRGFNSNVALINDNGNPAVIWARADNSGYTINNSADTLYDAQENTAIVFAKKEAGNWTSPTVIADVTAGKDYEVQAKADANGNVVVAWFNQDGEDVRLYAIVRQGSTWTSPAKISSGSPVGGIEVGFIAGLPAVIWGEASEDYGAMDLNLKIKKWVDGEWKSQQNFTGNNSIVESAIIAAAEAKAETIAQKARNFELKALGNPPDKCCQTQTPTLSPTVGSPTPTTSGTPSVSPTSSVTESPSPSPSESPSPPGPTPNLYGEVTDDGKFIEFNVRGFYPRDLNHPVTVPGSPDRPKLVNSSAQNSIIDIINGKVPDNESAENAPPRNISQQNCGPEALVGKASVVNLQTGGLKQVIALPPSIALENFTNIALEYNSNTINPIEIIAVDAWNDPNKIPPSRTTVDLNVAGRIYRRHFNSFSGDGYIRLPIDMRNVEKLMPPIGWYPFRGKLHNRFDAFFIESIGGVFGAPADPNGKMSTCPASEQQFYTTPFEGSMFVWHLAESPFGSGWSFRGLSWLYDTPKGLVIIDSDGTQIPYTPLNTGLGRRAAGTYLPPAGYGGQIVIDNRGFATRTDKYNNKYIYNNLGRLVETISADKLHEFFVYDDFGRLVKYKDQVKQVTKFAYQPLSYTITDHLGRKTYIKLSGKNNLLSASLPNQAKWKFDYTDKRFDNFITVATNPLGATTEYVYDKTGHISKINRNGLGWEEIQSANSAGLASPAISGATDDPSRNQVLTETGITASYTDTLGNSQSYLNQLGACGYTCSGKQTVTNALGEKTITYYDLAGNLTKVELPNGTIREFEYNEKGQLIRMQDNTNQIKFSYVYDAFTGLLSSMVDAAGNKRYYRYDQNGHLEKILGADGKVRYSFVNNKLGLPTKIFDANGNWYALERDAKGNVLSESNPLGLLTERKLNGLGMVLAERDALGRIETYNYFPSGRLAKYNSPLDQTTAYKYDVMDNITGIVDPKGNMVKFDYDNLSRLTNLAWLGGATETFKYDSEDNLIETTRNNGKVVTFEYDKLNRVTKRQIDGQESETFVYDSASNLTQISNNKAIIKSVYDTNQNLIKQIIDYNGESNPKPIEIQYTYDKMGKKQKISVKGVSPDINITYQYDKDQRLVKVTGTDGSTAEFEYDAAGRLLKLIRGNVITRNFYNNANQITRILHKNQAGIISAWDYDFDKVGNVLGINSARLQTDEISGQTYLWSATQTFAYDDADRLIKASDLPLPPGNETSYSPINGSGFVIDSGNQLLSDNAFTYEYQGGNLTKKTAKDSGEYQRYEYDADNHLIAAYIGAGTSEELIATYYYDGLGRRIGKEIYGITTWYIYDGQNVLARIDNHNNIIDQFVSALEADVPLIEYRNLSMEKLMVPFYPLQRADLSVTEIVDKNGKVVESFHYDAFGQIVALKGNLGRVYTFQGREYDPETGLIYYRKRHYDPQTGRFLQRDPHLDKKLLGSRYAFINNNPISLIAPDGSIEKAANQVNTFNINSLFEEIMPVEILNFYGLVNIQTEKAFAPLFKAGLNLALKQLSTTLNTEPPYIRNKVCGLVMQAEELLKDKQPDEDNYSQAYDLLLSALEERKKLLVKW